MKSLLPKWRKAVVRWPLLLASIAVTAGCSSDGGGDWRTYYEAVRMTLQKQDTAVSISAAGAIPYATLGIRIDEGQEQILVLATDMDEDQLWTSAAHIAIEMRGGRITSTAGFPGNLSARTTVTSGAEVWNEPHHYSWTGDFVDLGLYGVRIDCDVRPAGTAPIEILGKTFNTFRVDETCNSPALSWTFANAYWISVDSGRVWRSVQYFHPKGPQVELEVLRPPLSYQ